MTSSFVKAQFMSPPGADPAVPIGAVKAGTGISISSDGTISSSAGGGTITEIFVSNGIVGGGPGPQVYLSLTPPVGTSLGGVKTLAGSNISIDADGVIRTTNNTAISSTTGLNVTNLGSGSFILDLKPAGNTALGLGGVYVQAGSGLTLTSGNLTLSPPSAVSIGGVKAGTGVTIAPDGTLNATGSGGTITGVGAGTGLGGGGVTGAVTLFLRAPSGTTIGGVYAGDNVTIAADGRLSIAADTGVQTLTGVSPVQITGTGTNPIISVAAASTTTSGIVRLSDSTSATDSTLAATPTAVKSAYDLANAALSRAGGAMTGEITFTGFQTFPNTVSSGSFTQTGGLLVGDSSPASYAQLPVGSNGQVLVANTGAPLGIEWQSSPTNPTLQVVTANGAVTDIATTFLGGSPGETDRNVVVNGRTIKFFTDGTPDEIILIDNMPGGSQQFRLGTNFAIFNGTGGTAPRIGNRIPATGTFSVNGGTALNLELDLSVRVVLDSTGFNVNTPFKASNISYPTVDGSPGQALITDGLGNLSFSSSLLQKSGGTMTGNITFNGTQTFPGVVTSVGAADSTVIISGSSTSVLLDVATATTSAVGVVRPDGTTITIDGSGIISSSGSGLPLTGGTMTGNIVFAGTQTFPGTLPLAGGTMTGAITFNAGQAFPGTIASSLFAAAGGLITSSAAGVPSYLAPGAASTILAMNAGLPAWRTAGAAGLLTTTLAATTYAPLNSPTFTGPVIVNGGGVAGSNAFTITGGALVLSSSFTPASSSDTGSTGEISWDNDYLYVCVSPNTWGRIAIDQTPF